MIRSRFRQVFVSVVIGALILPMAGVASAQETEPEPGDGTTYEVDFERMNQLDLYDLTGDRALQGWTTIDVTRGGDHHPYMDGWWPDGHGLGYEHTFINQASDMLAVLGGGQPRVPLPDFADAVRTQRVLHAAIVSARERGSVTVDDL